MPAGEYTGLFNHSGRYDKSIKMVGNDPGSGITNNHSFLAHPNQFNKSTDTSAAWVNKGYSAGCQTIYGGKERYKDFTGTLESAGFNFSSTSTDTIKMSITDPQGTFTNSKGKEIDTHNQIK